MYLQLLQFLWYQSRSLNINIFNIIFENNNLKQYNVSWNPNYWAVQA
jgi:hypothetical protein